MYHGDTNETHRGKSLDYSKMLQVVLKIFCEQHQAESSSSATYLPSHKLSNQDEPDMFDTAGKVRLNS